MSSVCITHSYGMHTRIRILNSHFGTGTIEKLVLESYVKLLQDSEAEVRTSAAGSIARFSKFVSKTAILEKLLPCMNSLVSDPSEHVRSALASEIMGMASFDKASTATHLIPLYLRLLKDTSSDVRILFPLSTDYYFTESFQLTTTSPNHFTH